MGDHYIPQFYLKGFCEPDSPEIIARYEKGSRDILTTHVKNVAQETGFYSREVEQFLANEVEGPANLVLQTIRERNPITPEAKFILAVYMVTMLKRVPQSQVRIQEFAPEVVQSVFGQLDKELTQLADIYPEEAEVVQRRREQARRLRVQYEANVPKEVWLQLISPFTSPQTLVALSAMTWCFLTFDKGSAFLTSDNPVYFHSSIGIGQPDSEVSFPISSSVVLWATWRPDLREGFFPTKETLVREMNRRTASAATRYVFYLREEEWVANLINRKRHRLNRIN